MYKCSKITRKEFEEALDRLIEDSKKPRYIPWYMKLPEKEFMEYMKLLEEESKKYDRKYIFTH